MLTRPMLHTLWPRASDAKIDAIVQHAPEIFEKFEINTPLRVVHFMAQLSHENGGGSILRENMNYRAARLCEIFGGRSAYVTPQEAAALAGRPQAIAERVYGLGCPAKARDLGNSQPGDGYRFRGNGDLQLTGRDSHARIGKVIGLDLVNKPDLLERPDLSFLCAVAEFVELKCLPWADADDVLRVSKCVNLGNANSKGTPNGLAERKAWLRRWRVALEEEAAQVAEAPADQIDEALTAAAAPRAAEETSPQINSPWRSSTIRWAMTQWATLQGFSLHQMSDKLFTPEGVMIFMAVLGGGSIVTYLIVKGRLDVGKIYKQLQEAA